MEQMDLFTREPTEEWVFQLLYPALSEYLEHNNLGKDNITIDAGKNYSSVHFLTYGTDTVDVKGKIKEKTNKHLAFRICTRGKRSYFSVLAEFEPLAPADLSALAITVKGDESYRCYPFEPSYDGVMKFSDFLCKVLKSVVDSLPKGFDCCSRVEDCSDAGRCLNPNPDFAVACGYRKIMKKGRIYYGANRNIE